MTCFPKVDALIFRHSASSPPDFDAGPPIVPGVETGQVAFYYKADGKWYTRTHGGTEQEWGGGGAAGGWVNATLLNGWTNYSTYYYGTVQYRISGDRVDMRGMVSGGVPSDSNVLQLPPGHRPLKWLLVAVASHTGSVALYVTDNGYVYPGSPPGDWVSLFFSFYV